MARAPVGVRQALVIFLAFAFVYFFAALLRAVTATLAPVFSDELGLGAGQLGLLSGAYFLGFALMQLPLGSALDRWGARRVLLGFLAVAVVGCMAFAAAATLWQLLLARWLIGAGLAACLMAPLTCFRHHFSPAAQVRANAWMLMTGSLGMLASTLPVHWLLPLLGWRGLFMAVAGCLALAMLGVARLVPAQALARKAPGASGPAPAAMGGYLQVFKHPAFLRVAPLAFFAYGGLIAMQSLWIGPWLTQVGGRSPAQAAQGLFLVNLAMLAAFFCWGLVTPQLMRQGWAGERLIARVWPLGVLLLAAILWRAEQAGAWMWALWCVCTSAVSLVQPAVAQVFPAALAGRALSAFNLLVFSGVFVQQWGIGLAVDGLQAAGWGQVSAYRAAFGAFAMAGALSFLWLDVWRWRDAGAAAAQAAHR